MNSPQKSQKGHPMIKKIIFVVIIGLSSNSLFTFNPDHFELFLDGLSMSEHRGYQNLDLNDADLSGLIITNKTFTNVNFRNANFRGVTFVNVRFHKCKLDDALFIEALTENVRFEKCSMNKANFSGTNLNRVYFDRQSSKNIILFKANNSSVSVESLFNDNE